MPSRFSGKRTGLAMKMYHGEDVDERKPKAPNTAVVYSAKIKLRGTQMSLTSRITLAV